MLMIDQLREEHRLLLVEAKQLRAPTLQGEALFEQVSLFRKRALDHMRHEDNQFYVPLCKMRMEPFSDIAETICRDAFFVEQDVEVFGDLWSLPRARVQWDEFSRALGTLADLLEYRVSEEERIFFMLRKKGLELEQITSE